MGAQHLLDIYFRDSNPISRVNPETKVWNISKMLREIKEFARNNDDLYDHINLRTNPDSSSCFFLTKRSGKNLSLSSSLWTNEKTRFPKMHQSEEREKEESCDSSDTWLNPAAKVPRETDGAANKNARFHVFDNFTCQHLYSWILKPPNIKSIIFQIWHIWDLLIMISWGLLRVILGHS